MTREGAVEVNAATGKKKRISNRIRDADLARKEADPQQPEQAAQPLPGGAASAPLSDAPQLPHAPGAEREQDTATAERVLERIDGAHTRKASKKAARKAQAEAESRTHTSRLQFTEEERAKCQKVADAFAELYEMADIVVVDVGRYGFVMLKYYTPPHGFEEDATFTDSKALFEGLWQEWLDMKLYFMAKGTSLMETGYKGIFESLSKEKQSELIMRKATFAKAVEIYL